MSDGPWIPTAFRVQGLGFCVRTHPQPMDADAGWSFGLGFRVQGLGVRV